MSFRHISKVLADARLTAGDLAARGHDGAHNLGPVTSGANATGMQDGMSGKGMGGGTPVREDADVPPDAQADEGGTASELNGKGRGTVKATASVRGGAEQLRGGTASAPHTAYGQRMKPALRIVSSRCEPARNAANRDTPPRRVGSHLVLVVDHAALRSNTGTSMRSRNS